jgi:hypothetical protein
VLCGDAVDDHQDHPNRDPGDTGPEAELGQRARESSDDRPRDRHETAEHQDQPDDDHQVHRDPDLALGDHSGHAQRVVFRSRWMEQVADHRQQGSDKAAPGPEAYNPCFALGSNPVWVADNVRFDHRPSSSV